MCANQQLYQVRVMSSKALSSLIPLQKVPQQVVSILQQIISSFKISQCEIEIESPINHQFSPNLLHGLLLQVNDLLTNLKWFVSGESADMGNNEIFYANIVNEVSSIVVPKLVRLQQAMVSVAIEEENESSATVLRKYFPFAPAILIILKRIVAVVHQMSCSDLTTELLTKICEMNISILLDSSHVDVLLHSDVGGNISIPASRIPFAPLLWKESLIDLVGQVFKNELSRQYPALRILKTFSSSGLSHFSLSSLLHLINHPISEVREGVILGCLAALSDISRLDTSILEDLPPNKVLVLSYFSLSGRTENDRYKSFFTILLQRAIIEMEPPILEITLQLTLR
jgi:hypothetical protein